MSHPDINHDVENELPEDVVTDEEQEDAIHLLEPVRTVGDNLPPGFNADGEPGHWYRPIVLLGDDRDYE